MCQSRTNRFKEPALLSERWLFFFFFHFSLSEKYLRALRALATGVTYMLCNNSCEDWQGSYHQAGRCAGSSAETVTGGGGGRDALKEREEWRWERSVVQRWVKTETEGGFGCILTVVSIVVLFWFLCLGFYLHFLSALCSRVVLQAS